MQENKCIKKKNRYTHKNMHAREQLNLKIWKSCRITEQTNDNTGTASYYSYTDANKKL